MALQGEHGIAWTDRTWNPVTGCTKVSQGCKHCYAERIFQRPYPGRAFTDVRTHPDRLDAPLRWRKPCRIFVNSMSDLFHESVPVEFIDRVFSTMAICTEHTFQVLTKRPVRMLQCVRDLEWRVLTDGVSLRAINWPRPSVGATAMWPLPNVWLGVSVENQATADERIPLLLQTSAAVRWISAEPLLGPVDLVSEIGGLHVLGCGYANCNCNRGLDWVVCGGESGPGARPMEAEWARSLRDQCAASSVPFFFKQWGEWLPAGQDGKPGALWHLNASDEAVRLGKKNAGRRLDGREHNEFPHGVRAAKSESRGVPHV